jgi:hypothetical protein
MYIAVSVVMSDMNWELWIDMCVNLILGAVSPAQPVPEFKQHYTLLAHGGRPSGGEI